MADILGELHKFVPKVRKEQEFYVDEQTEPACVQVDYFNHILIGGDQLTVARIRGCQRVRIVKLFQWRRKLGRTHTIGGRLARQDEGMTFITYCYFIRC